MDPFSLTVGVAGLAALVLQTIKAANSYLSGAKEASDSAKALVTELEAVQSSLLRLDEFLSKEAAKGTSFAHTSALRSTATAFEAKLQHLCKKLQGVGEGKIKRLLWPLSRDEHLRAIQDLRAFVNWIQFGLSLDSSSLLSRTSDDVLLVLRHQIAAIEALQIAEDQNAEFKVAIHEQTAILQRAQDSNARKAILDWISQTDYSDKHNAVRLPRVPDTGTWLLERQEYCDWRDGLSKSGLLWCQGVQGSGKSVLTSLVIDRLRGLSANPDHPVSFVYFDHRDEQQSAHIVVASILRQTVAALPVIPASVQEMHLKLKGSEHRVTLEKLTEAFISVTACLAGVFVVIDGLDECAQQCRSDLLQFLSRLREISTVRIFVTSRPHPQDIQNSLGSSPQIEVQAHDADLRQYMIQEIQGVCEAGVIDFQFAMSIISKILRAAKGLFLLVVLQLRSILKEPTAGDMEDALEGAGSSLSEAFEDTISRIKRLPEGRKRLAIRALLWTCHAKRLLLASELVEALAIKPDQNLPNPKYRPSINMILECCQGLISVDPNTKIVRLAHYSIQEYLIQHGEDIFPRAQAEIAETCLTYLMFDEFKKGPCLEESSLDWRLKSFPLFALAALIGCEHAAAASVDPKVASLVSELLRCPGAIASCQQATRYIKGYRKEYWLPEEASSHSPLHFACYYGFDHAINDLIQMKGTSIDVQTAIGSTPLILAASRGHLETVRLLLFNGADPTISNRYGNSLHCAAEAGRVNTIRELLRHGVDPDARRSCGLTALHSTADKDHADAADVLIQAGADIDARDPTGMTVLHLAAEGGCRELVRLLLTRYNVDVNMTVKGELEGRSKDNIMAFHLAFMNRDTWMTRLLFDAGAARSCTLSDCPSLEVFTTVGSLSQHYVQHHRSLLKIIRQIQGADSFDED